MIRSAWGIQRTIGSYEWSNKVMLLDLKYLTIETLFPGEKLKFKVEQIELLLTVRLGTALDYENLGQNSWRAVVQEQNGIE